MAAADSAVAASAAAATDAAELTFTRVEREVAEDAHLRQKALVRGGSRRPTGGLGWPRSVACSETAPSCSNLGACVESLPYARGAPCGRLRCPPPNGGARGGRGAGRLARLGEERAII